MNGAIKTVYDNNILAEYIDVLNRERFRINKDLIKAVLDYITKNGEYIIAEPQDIQFDDEDDKAFYDVYKSSGANYIVTGNKKHFPKEDAIITPREFIEINYSI